MMRSTQLACVLQRFSLSARCRFLIVFLTLTGFVSVAGAEVIDESFVTGSQARLELSNVAGEILISGWDGDQVVLSGELHNNARLELHHDGQRVTVKVVKKSGFRRMGSSDLQARVPFDSELSIYAVSADVAVTHVLGAQRLTAVSGDIRVSGFASDLEVKSVSGDVYLQGSSAPGRITAVSVSGDIDIRNVAGELEARSVSGDANVVGVNFDRIRFKSTSGEVGFSGGLSTDGRFDAETVSGGVTIGLASAASLDVEVETFSGRITNCLGEKSQRKNKAGPGQVLHFTRGPADRDVRVRSLSGRVSLCAKAQS